MFDYRIGHGYDVHRFAKERELILCGVNIPCEVGLLGHSDADVATHALCDSLLGACAMGDIGKHFPDTDESYKGADSIELLKEVRKIIGEYEISNIDITIIAQKPKLAPYIEEMRKSLAAALSLSIDRVSVKATTEEKLGFTGRCEGISAHSVALIYKH